MGLAIAVLQRVMAVRSAEQQKEAEQSRSVQAVRSWKGKRNPVALIVTNTRELAEQMERVIVNLTQGISLFDRIPLCYSVVGGTSVTYT